MKLRLGMSAILLLCIHSMVVANTEPTVIINSAVMRPGTSYMDINFRVNDPDDATVKVRALGFVDGVRSFANVVQMNTFEEGTGANIGDAVLANTDLSLTWNVPVDWNVDLAEVHIDIMARDGRGMLPFEWITIPATTNPVQSELTISKNAPTDTEVLDSLFWLYADGDSGLVLTNGNLVANDASMGGYDGMTLVAGAELQRPWGPSFAMMRMNLKPADAEERAFAFYARAGLLNPDRLRAVNQAYQPIPATVPGSMVLVDGGSLPSIGNGDLNVTNFYIGKYEVTKAEWDTVYNWAVTNSYSFTQVGSGAGTNYPVHTVRWYDVVKWCNAKSEMEGLTPVYQAGAGTYRAGESNDVTVVSAANGYRLPTDAEWEYAARGGKYSQGYTYSGGDDASAVAWHSGNTASSSPVGWKMFNELGLHDMSGNLYEWCFDWDPDRVGTDRILRGGSWLDSAGNSQVSFWISYTPDSAYNDFGFRVSRNTGN